MIKQDSKTFQTCKISSTKIIQETILSTYSTDTIYLYYK